MRDRCVQKIRTSFGFVNKSDVGFRYFTFTFYRVLQDGKIMKFRDGQT